jgi:hypothetical protein
LKGYIYFLDNPGNSRSNKPVVFVSSAVIPKMLRASREVKKFVIG